jgi:16S rRNA (cytosine967-C5)-methyltransferase
VALKALISIEKERSYANLALPSFLKDSNLSVADKALVTEIVYGSIRLRGTYDKIIDSVSNRPVDTLDLEVREILRMGAHQLLNMRVASHAAVDTAVTLTKQEINQSSSGFVNAILRKVSKFDFEQWITNLGFTDKLDQLSIQYSHPRWILESYLTRLGDMNRVEQECIANNKNPKVCVIGWPNQASQVELLESNEDFSPAPWVDSGVEITGDPGDMPAIKGLRASVQDQGSFLVSKAFVDIPLENDDFWLDLCAGPGGKSALLDRWAQERNIGFVANEISPHRAKLMQRSTDSIILSDGLTPAFKEESFTRILVDAPCSGLGALRRRPDARWRKNQNEILDLVKIQIGLLEKASKLIKIGGILGYVTCSPHSSETIANADKFLAEHPNFTAIPAAQHFPIEMNLQESNSVQLWPGLHGTDGMFLAVFQRVSK